MMTRLHRYKDALCIRNLVVIQVLWFYPNKVFFVNLIDKRSEFSLIYVNFILILINSIFFWSWNWVPTNILNSTKHTAVQKLFTDTIIVVFFWKYRNLVSVILQVRFLFSWWWVLNILYFSSQYFGFEFWDSHTLV